MKVSLHPERDFRTSVPITVSIGEASPPLKLQVIPLGEIPLKPAAQGGLFAGTFWVEQAGEYQLVVTGPGETWEQVISIEQQTYLNFGQEFGFFALLFTLMISGVVLWTVKLKKTNG